MNSPMPSHSSLWQAYLHNCRSLVAMAEPTRTAGRITRVAGLVMEAVGLKLPSAPPMAAKSIRSTSASSASTAC